MEQLEHDCLFQVFVYLNYFGIEGTHFPVDSKTVDGYGLVVNLCIKIQDVSRVIDA